MIKIQVATEIEISIAEFRKRIGEINTPEHSLFDVVEYVGEFKNPAIGLVIGLSLRAGGWMYDVRSLIRDGISSKTIAAKDIIRVLTLQTGEGA